MTTDLIRWMGNRPGAGPGWRLGAGCLIAALMPLAAATAAPITRTAPDFDRWNYPFNGTPGTRGTVPTFGAVGSTFDDRDGQFLVGFDLSADLPTLGAGEFFRVTSLTVTATHSSGSFVYDPTYDSFNTFLDPADPDFAADADPGRPISLTGAALRSTVGYSAFSFNDVADPTASNPPFYGEDETFGFGDPTAKGTRSAFAFDPNSVSGSNPFGNVSNNVSEAFDFVPFAIGTTGLNPGDAVTEASPGVSPGSTFTFTVDVADSGIQDYLSQSLAGGGLFLTISSLHSTSQAGGANPNFYTTDNFDPASVPATLTLSFDVVPEPSGAALALTALAAFAARRRRIRPARSPTCP